MPALQRLHRRDAAGHRRQLPSLGGRQPDPAAAAAHDRPAVRSGRCACHRRRVGPDVRHDDLVELRPWAGSAGCKRLRADTEQRSLLARQPRREQRQPAPRRRGAARRRGRVLDHEEQHRRQRLRSAQHGCRRRDQQQREARPGPEQLVGRADGCADAADSRTSCVAERRRAVADDLQPAHPREPGQRQPRRERGLPGGCLRFRLGQVLPLPLEHAVRPARRRVPDRGRADRDE